LTQVQLTDEQLKALRRLSAAVGRPIPELIRNAIDHLVLDRGERADRAIRVAGMFSSGSADSSGHHDRHMAEAFER